MSEPRSPGLGPVLLAVLIDLLGFGLVIPLLAFYAESFDATPLQVTLLAAIYSLAQFACAPLWGRLSDRIGRRPVMLFSIAGTAVMLAGFASAPSLVWLFVCRALHGACAANISTAQAYVADITTPENRARGMGLIGASFGIGFSLGPWLGGELSPYGLTVPIWAAAALSAVNFAWAVFRLPESRPVDARTRSERPLDPRAFARALAHPVVGMAIGLAFAATAAFAMMEGTFSLVAEHSWAMDARGVGRMFGLIGGIGILIQGGLIHRLVRRFGEPGLVVAGYAANAAGLSALAFAPPGPAVWAGCAAIAVGTSLANPSLTSLISRGAGADDQGAVLGVNQSLGALARAAGPAAGGLLYAHWFRGGAFLAGSLLMASAMAAAWPIARRAAARY
jgi:multidrug resistance protein